MSANDGQQKIDEECPADMTGEVGGRGGPVLRHASSSPCLSQKSVGCHIRRVHMSQKILRAKKCL